MNLKPLFDRVILSPKKTKEKTLGGIVLPPASLEKSQIAKVVAVGEGEIVDGKIVPTVLKVGQSVLYSKYAGSEIDIREEKFIVIKQTDILAVLEGEE